MKPDLDLGALAEAIAQAQADQSSSSWLAQQGQRLARWLGQLARRFLAKASPFAAFAVAVGVLLHLAHVNLGSLLMPTVYAGPFIAVAVASFVAHAWRQNSTTPVYGTGQEVGQVASPLGQVQLDLAKPVAALPPTVITALPAPPVRLALPAPAAALPQAVGQTAPIHYPTPDAEEETP